MRWNTFPCICLFLKIRRNIIFNPNMVYTSYKFECDSQMYSSKWRMEKVVLNKVMHSWRLFPYLHPVSSPFPFHSSLLTQFLLLLSHSFSRTVLLFISAIKWLSNKSERGRGRGGGGGNGCIRTMGEVSYLAYECSLLLRTHWASLLHLKLMIILQHSWLHFQYQFS